MIQLYMSLKQKESEEDNIALIIGKWLFFNTKMLLKEINNYNK